jgi:hypothetical protein
MTRIHISRTLAPRFAAAPRLAAAAVFAAAVALGVSGLGYPAVAAAKQIDWHAYHDCVDGGAANNYNVQVELCCIQAGGFVVADRQTNQVSCWDHDPTPEECKYVIGAHCARQVPPGVNQIPPDLRNAPPETLTTAPPPPASAG